VRKPLTPAPKVAVSGTVSGHGTSGPKRTDPERRNELLRRVGIDLIRVDRRSLAEILNDEIPYEKWENEKCSRNIDESK
jgi:hypothetical protein